MHIGKSNYVIDTRKWKKSVIIAKRLIVEQIKNFSYASSKLS